MLKKILTPTEYSRKIDSKREHDNYINEFAEWFNNELTTRISTGVATIRSVELFDIPDKFTINRESDTDSLKFTTDIVNYLNDYGWAVQDVKAKSEFPHTKNLVQLVPK